MKKEIREKYRKIRKNIEDKKNKDTIIYKKIISDKIWNNFDTVLIYVSTLEEVDTLELIKFFINKKNVAVPKIEKNKINFYYINSLDDLKVGFYNILEPITNNKVLDYSNSICYTPGICFSKEGYRVGYGGGYYDRFFEENDVYSIGLCYKECLIDNIKTNSYDRKVNCVITD